MSFCYECLEITSMQRYIYINKNLNLMNKYTLIAFISATVLLNACKKDKQIQSPPPATTSSAKIIADSAVNIINPTGKYITFGWVDTNDFSTKPKICPGYKGIDSIIIAPYDTVNLPTSRFCGDFSCGYAYYSDDFTINNWHKKNAYPYTRREGFAGSLGSKIIIRITDTPSKYLLRCLGSFHADSTRWIAIDAYNAAGTSVWGSLSTNEKNQQLYINGDLVWYKYKGYINGKTDSAKFWFAIMNTSPDFLIEMKTNDYATSTVTQCKLTDKLPTSSPISTAAMDTMFMTINGAPPYYKLYRKP